MLTIQEDVEAALGAPRLAALGVALIGHDDSDKWVTLARRAMPDSVRKRRYDDVFGIYAALYPALKASMHACMHALTHLRGPAS